MSVEVVDMGSERDVPVVVAGIGSAALPIAVAALEAGHAVVRWVTGPHELPSDAGERVARLAAAAPADRLTRTAEPGPCAGFRVAVLTQAPEHDPDIDGFSPVEHYAAGLASALRQGSLVAISCVAAEHAGAVVDATIELLTGLRAGRDYPLAYLFPPAADGRWIASGIDAGSVEQAREWLTTIGLTSMPVMPVGTAEIVSTLLPRHHAPPESVAPEH